MKHAVLKRPFGVASFVQKSRWSYKKTASSVLTRVEMRSKSALDFTIPFATAKNIANNIRPIMNDKKVILEFSLRCKFAFDRISCAIPCGPKNIAKNSFIFSVW